MSKDGLSARSLLDGLLVYESLVAEAVLDLKSSVDPQMR